MLVRLLRSMLSSRPAPLHVPTPEQARLLQEALSALASSDMARFSASLEAMGRAGPPCAVLHRTLGSALGSSGQLELARNELERAVALDPSHAGAWADLGNVHRLGGRIDDAQQCYSQALALDPSAAAVRVSFALLEAASGRHQTAIDRLLVSIATNPDVDTVETLCQLLDSQGRVKDAKAVCEDVLNRHPGHGAAHSALGCLLLKRDFRPEAALRHFEQALAAGHRTEQLLYNRGVARGIVLQDLARLDEAIASYDEAIPLKPEYPLAVFHRSLALLLNGDFKQAWPDYEMRLFSEDRPSAPLELPVWNGVPTTREVLVYGEQGIGDEIMFASCIGDLQQRCQQVTLACTAKLERLFRRSFPDIEVISLEQARDPDKYSSAPPQLIVPIGSLPLHFRRDRADFPSHTGYLRADPALAVEYRGRLADLGPGMKIGLSWRGGLNRTRRGLRSLALNDFAPILELPGVHFVNLQYDSRTDEEPLASEIKSGRIAHWQDALDDYDRTAALVSGLDVVVSVCTAVIHLAGALGTPTRILAPFSPEWRYGIAGHDMPWYPSVRIVRQSSPGQWQPVIEAVRDDVFALTRTIPYSMSVPTA